MEKSPSFERYITQLDKTIDRDGELSLVVMGRDPFRTDAIGVPFCKPEWSQQQSYSCSGGVVLRSILGSLLGVESLYPKPIDIFMALARSGVGFLNLSYSFLGKTQVRKLPHRAELESAWRTNVKYVDRAAHVLYCGEAKKNCWYGSPVRKGRGCLVCHPDRRNQHNKYVKDEWTRWWDCGAIRDRFGLAHRLDATWRG